jgi:hypothetical protein
MMVATPREFETLRYEYMSAFRALAEEGPGER